MTHKEAHALEPGTLVVTSYPPRSICRFVRLIPSQWSMQLETVHKVGIDKPGVVMNHYYSGMETLEEASICHGKHLELHDNGSCIVCGFSREAQEWEKAQ